MNLKNMNLNWLNNANYNKYSRKTLQHNGRFRASGGVAPQKRQCDFGSFAPARAAVNPRLREAASTLCVSVGQCVGLHKRFFFGSVDSSVKNSSDFFQLTLTN